MDVLLTGAAKEAWNSTVSLFEGLFDGHDGSAPTNSDGTVNTGLIDNSLLNLDIRTDLKSGFLSNNDITQIGNIIFHILSKRHFYSPIQAPSFAPQAKNQPLQPQNQA